MLKLAKPTIGRVSRTICGWLVIYVSVGGLLGFGLVDGLGMRSPCLPKPEIFGLIRTDCPIVGVDEFWSIFVGIPRLFLVFPALGIAFVRAFLLNDYDFSYFLEAAVWFLYSVPLVIIAFVGMRFWDQRVRRLGQAAVLALLVEAIVLGFQE